MNDQWQKAIDAARKDSKKRIYRHHESNMIQTCLKWFALQYPNRIVIKIDNEGKRSKAAGAIKKREGLKPGASDLFFPEPIFKHGEIEQITENELTRFEMNTRIFHGMWLEGKHGDNVLTPDQIEFQNQMHRRGYYCGTFYNIDEFVRHCNAYFGTQFKSNKWK